MLYPSDAEAMEMYRRKIDLLEKQSKSTFGGNTIAAVFIALLCWSFINKIVLVAWAIAVSSTVYIRLRKVLEYKHRADPGKLEECFNYCARSVFINGCVWSVLLSYLAIVLEPSILVYPFMVLCAVSAGTCLLYNTHYNPFRNYALPALLLPGLALFVSGEPLKMWIGVVVICWFALMYSISSQLQRYLAGANRYETENIALIRDLEFQKEKTERLNEELRLKSEIIHRLAQRDSAELVDANDHRSKAAEK